MFYDLGARIRNCEHCMSWFPEKGISLHARHSKTEISLHILIRVFDECSMGSQRPEKDTDKTLGMPCRLI